MTGTSTAVVFGLTHLTHITITTVIIIKNNNIHIIFDA